MARQVVLAVTLAMIVVLGTLTGVVLVRNGPDPLVVVSLLVLALFGFGVVGALRHPPPPEP